MYKTHNLFLADSRHSRCTCRRNDVVQVSDTRTNQNKSEQTGTRHNKPQHHQVVLVELIRAQTVYRNIFLPPWCHIGLSGLGFGCPASIFLAGFHFRNGSICWSLTSRGEESLAEQALWPPLRWLRRKVRVPGGAASSWKWSKCRYVVLFKVVSWGLPKFLWDETKILTSKRALWIHPAGRCPLHIFARHFWFGRLEAWPYQDRTIPTVSLDNRSLALGAVPR